MAKLSVNTIQTRLLAEEEMRKVKVERMKSTTAPKSKEVGKITDPSTRITKIKQIAVPAGSEPKEKQSGQIIPAGERADKIIDGFERGIFQATASDEKSPAKPSVKSGTKANQTTKLKQVTASKNEDRNTKMDIVPAGKDARDITDGFDRGIFKNGPGETKQRSTPSYAKGNATTKAMPAITKKADLSRDPKVTVKDPASGGLGAMPMPKDAPKTPSWASVKGGVIVEVQGRAKASLDIVSESVLRRMVESYEQAGYTVTLRRNKNVGWKNDKALFGMIRESIDAKHNDVLEQSKAFRRDAFKHFYESVKGNHNGFYESKDEFLEVCRDAFKLVEAQVEAKYLGGLEIFGGIVRVQTNEGLEDIELMTEATGRDMAVRRIRSKIAEEYGMDVQIKHIFIDGTKVSSKASAWAPSRVVAEKKELPAFIQDKIDAKKGKKMDESPEGIPPQAVAAKQSPTMRFKAAQKAFAPHGIVLKWDPSNREFKVNFIKGHEDTAYYTDDLDDAIGTARQMIKHQEEGLLPSAFIKINSYKN